MTTKGQFIIQYLDPMYPDGDYVLSIYNAWCRFKPGKPGTYGTFREALRRLKNNDGIELYKHEPQNRPNVNDAVTFGKRYYRVKRDNI